MRLSLLLLLTFFSFLVSAQCPTGDITSNFTVTANCTYNGDLEIDEATLTVNPGVTLTITGKLINAQNSNAIARIDGGGTIVIQDKFENKKNGFIVIDNVTIDIDGEFDSDADDTDVTIQNGATIEATKFKGGKNSEIIINGSTITLTDDFENNKDNANTTISNGSSITAVDFKIAKNSTTSIDNSTLDLSGKWDGNKDNTTLTVSNGSTINTGDEFKIGKGADIDFTDSTLDVDGQFKGDKDNVDISFTGTTVDVDGDFKSGKNSQLTLDNTDLTVTGDLDMDKDNADLTVSNGGDLTVSGDFDSGKNSQVDVGTTGGGTISIGGDFDNSKDNADITIGDGGQLDIDGSFSNGKNSDVVVNNGGELVIDTDLNNNKDGATVDIQSGGSATVGGTINDPNSGFTSADGDDCSDGCCGSGCSVLPVTLVSFKVADDGNGLVRLHWVTASEVNNQGFEVQESFDGQKFSNVDFIKGNGTTNSEITYQFSYFPSSIVKYFRLKQIDFNGAFEYSSIQFLNKDLESFDIQLGPNPLESHQSLAIYNYNSNISELEVYDSSGRLIYQHNGSIAPDLNELNYKLHNNEPGVYLLRFSIGQEVLIKRLLVR